MRPAREVNPFWRGKKQAVKLGFLKNLLNLSGGKGKNNIEELSRRLGITIEELKNITPKYSEFEIPKRSGGVRKISAPDKKLKEVQRKILHKILGRLKWHPCATGFNYGSSIVSNAMQHVGKAVVLKMDVKDFFSSTQEKRIAKYFAKIGWDKEGSRLLTHLCTYNGSLPQGAPTSPKLSNLINYRLDERLAGLAKRMDAVYTRYADDITFSFLSDEHQKISNVMRFAKNTLKNEGYKLHHKKKLHIRRKYNQQIVTGLVVNKKVNLPRKTRRWLRAVEYNFKNEKHCTLKEKQIEGWRSFLSMIEKQGGN